jgi:hypothetical protein
MQENGHASKSKRWVDAQAALRVHEPPATPLPCTDLGARTSHIRLKVCVVTCCSNGVLVVRIYLKPRSVAKDLHKQMCISAG